MLKKVYVFRGKSLLKRQLPPLSSVTQTLVQRSEIILSPLFLSTTRRYASSGGGNSSGAQPNSSGIISFNLPDIGEGIAEVEVLKWYVTPGTKIAQFDKLLEVQSDKATVDITSRYDGTVHKLLYKPGDMAKTGSVLLEIKLSPSSLATYDGHTSNTPEITPTTQSTATSSVETPSSSNDSSRTRGIATPAVRHIAKQHGLSVSNVIGTGKGGRVTKDDLLKVIEGKESEITSSEESKTASTRPSISLESTEQSLLPPQSFSPISISSNAQDSSVPIRGLQRIMVKSMSASWSTIPHFGLCDEVIMDKLMTVRNELRPIALTMGIKKLTYLPFLIKATSLALSSYPQLNAQLSAAGDSLLHRGSHNIGIAMDTPRGLIVPNVKAVQSRSVFDIALELARLQLLAQQGKLGESDLSDTTFSLSNVGTIGGTYASPIIPLPNVGIGALGRIAKQPRFASTLPGASIDSKDADDEDDIVAAHVMQISWSADHRVIDGATLARFSNNWKGLIEAPATMLAKLR
jgi:2-oxoisovalerate dehydrogenase E2 component (dihydrolipoyl transacylase)